jgi:sugar/nucleoside kinase (ribokinase family)
VCSSDLNGSAVSINQDWKETIYLAIETAKKNGVKISFDPNIRPEILGVEKVRALCQPIIENASIVFPSGEEATMLTGKKNPEEAVFELLEKGTDIVVLKKGSLGSTVYSRGTKYDVPAFEVEEIDPTGAGDCFDAGFLVSLIQKRSLKESARYANAVGALAVTRKGPMEGAPFPEEVDKLITLSKK